MLIGIGADDAAIPGPRPQVRAATGAAVGDQSIFGRDVHPVDMPADGARKAGFKDGVERGLLGHGVSSAVS